MARDWEQVNGQAPAGRREQPSPRVRRLLRRQPRPRPPRQPGSRPSGPGPAAVTGPEAAQEGARAGALAEWHEMTSGEQAARWAQLRAWVTWLHDRYELSVEDRLPRCWARHPGLVEELSALMAWRQEIYGSGLQPAGQAARYWHAELRQVLHAATVMYAAGCRTGHRPAPRLAAGDTVLLGEWAAVSPLDQTPAIDLAAGTARLTGHLIATAGIAAALDDGEAITVPGTRDTIFRAGTWLEPASTGWVPVPGPAPLTTPCRPAPPALPDTEGIPDPWQP